MSVGTIRDEVLELLLERSLTTIFSNPGSTEIPLLTDLPDTFDFRLGLHEGSVVGMATGYAIGRGEPALCLLHTTAGLGNAVGALATARANRVPLVVLVGQQDRRHLVYEPFLAGRRLELLAGDHVVWVAEPRRAQDVPSLLDEAWHMARAESGPALLIVPMDDWNAVAGPAIDHAAPGAIIRPRQVAGDDLFGVAALVDAARSPALIVGAGAADDTSWVTLEALATKLACPVWQEAFGSRPGFPQDHPQFAGHLPAGRAALRACLEPHDLVVVVGAAAFRQYLYEPGRFLEEGTSCVVITEDHEEAVRSAANIAVVGQPGAICRALTAVVKSREPWQGRGAQPPMAVAQDAIALTPRTVFDALATRAERDTVIVEESPSSRDDLSRHLPARSPLGFVSAAMGGLGFGLPAAIGLRMALPGRPVIACLGDGSSLYAIQSLWSAAYYKVGLLIVVLENGGYAIMDRLAALSGGAGPWPALTGIDIATIASGFGCQTFRVSNQPDLDGALDSAFAGLRSLDRPIVLCARVTRTQR